MSEAKLPFKKAIPIIAVTWILSLGTTLALVYFAPNIFPRAWHEVIRFGNEYDIYTREDTEVFYVRSQHWKIEWAVMESYYPSPLTRFKFSLVSENDFTNTQCSVTPSDFEWKDSYSGTEYITGSGEFFITVAGENVYWSIRVEAYY